MKFTFYNFLMVMSLFLIMSCGNEESNDLDIAEEGIELRDEEKMYEEGCYQLVYPITIIFADGSSYTGEDRMSLGLAIRKWYKANGDRKTRPSFEYPIEIVFGESTITVNSDEELTEIKSKCKSDYEEDDKEREKCIEIIFPVKHEFTDGTIVVINSKEEWKAIIKRWREANPDSKEKGSLVYPIDIKFNGELLTINSAEEMDRVKATCKDRGEDHNKGRCIELIYPLSYVFADGVTVTVNSREEWKTTIKRWREANPDSKERGKIVYPIDIKFNGELLTINSAEEMDRAKAVCKDGKGDDKDEEEIDYDCPELRADVGDKCYKSDRTKGKVSVNCECE